MSALTVGSLFSGIGGLELGLERVGMKILWQVEKDPYARKVLAKNWPDVRRYENVCSVHGRPPTRSDTPCDRCLPRVDVVCGGFPCQDLSYAGKGAGLKEGTRSGLWFEYARLIRELRPRFVLVENVPALRSRGLDVVLGDLAESGYDAEWDCIPARAVGAPHQRDRLFIVAYPRGQRVEGQSTGVGPCSSGPWGWRGEEDLRALTGNPFGAQRWPAPLLRGVAHGVPSRVDRLRCLGNAVVPQVAEFVGRRVMEIVNQGVK